MKDLVQIIKDNPGCIAIVDNDCWQLWKQHPDEQPDDEDAYDAWEAENLLASDGEVKSLGDGGYGSGNCYGGDILQALAAIVGITVESV
jgi:hypothetical protein